MPNSYSVVPNVLPGNVTIGGNLIVGGDQVTIGAAVPKVRIGKDTFSKAILSYNLGFDDLTLDTNADLAQAMGLNVQGTGYVFERHNAAGFPQTLALSCPIFSDYTQHVHTGTTTVDQIYSKVIRGGIMGANGGLHIMVVMTDNVQGAAATQVKILLGGVQTIAKSFNALTHFQWDVFIINRNAQNAQFWRSIETNLAGNSIAGLFNSTAIDTSVDQALTVTVQSGANTDSQSFELCYAELANSFGPV